MDPYEFCWVIKSPPSLEVLKKIPRHGETPQNRSGLDEAAATCSGEELSETW